MADLAGSPLLGDSEPPKEKKRVTHHFRPSSSLKNIWDDREHDEAFLNKVKVQMTVYMNFLDPKEGTWEASTRCDWQFRLPKDWDPNTKGLLPSMSLSSSDLEMQEERIFNDKDFDTESTKMWRGISSFKLSGHERFEVSDFPYDRQLVDLGQIDFLWLPERVPIKVVDLHVKTLTRTACWDAAYAIVEAKEVQQPDGHPAHADSFNVFLRFQRKPEYFITNIFLVAGAILIVSLFPMAMDPQNEFGDRLACYAGGVLTLVAFKYAIAEELPSVPYSTLADQLLSAQIFTVVFAMLDALVGYKLIHFGMLSPESVDVLDDILLIILTSVWLVVLFYMAVIKKRRKRPWAEVMASQEAVSEEFGEE